MRILRACIPLACLIGIAIILGSLFFRAASDVRERDSREATSVGFSPGTALPLVLNVISKCEKTLDIATYDFTSQTIAQAIIGRKSTLKIRVVMDKRTSNNNGTVLPDLIADGIPLRVNGHYAIHHNKFIVCDGRLVETGSFNYTNGAIKRNAENVLVLWNNPNAAEQYEKEFNRLWDQAEQPS
jgi:phosphatidylserine/phosphatidylglycerophosphate/cardiolipin synthase-like enzyme